MSLVKENYTLIRGCILAYVLVSLSSMLSFGQDVCPIWTALEPKVSSDISRNYKTNNKGLAQTVSWSLTDSSDAASIALDGYRISKSLVFNDFGFNIPDGATIQGIKVSVIGRSEGDGFIRDHDIRLSSPNKKSENYAGRGYSTLKMWKKGTTYKTWHYGWPDETWGTNWTSDDINASDFELAIQIRNLFNKDITGFIKDIKIEVTFLPLVIFCPTDCPIFYVDSVDNTTMYQWHIPSQFQLISKSDQFHIINLHVKPNTPIGKYNICVDAIKDNQIQSSCCRTFRYQMCEPASIGDFVFEDANMNGIQDIGENGIEGIQIELFNALGIKVDQTLSNQNGKYSFANITPGAYYIKVNNTNDFAFAPAGNGNKNTDSDITNANGIGTSDFFNLDFDQVDNSIDIGLVGLGTISGSIWEDCNADGIRSNNDTLISNTTIRLLDINGLLIEEYLSPDGNYVFDDLFYGDYQVQFVLGQDYNSTLKNIGTIVTDSDVNNNARTDILTLTMNDLSHIDGGFFKYGTIGDQVWYDDNCNGIFDLLEDGLEGIKLYLYNTSNELIDSITTNSDGNYLFDQLQPDSYYLELVSNEDYTAVELGSSKLNDNNGSLSSDTILIKSGVSVIDLDLAVINRRADICGLAWLDVTFDGQRTIDEPILSGIQVNLLDQTNQTIMQSMTDLDGAYCFTDLLPGIYFIQFVIDSNYIISPFQIGDVDTDNDALPNAQTNPLTLLSGKPLHNIDLGVGIKPILGGMVWLDDNRDSIKNPTEIGIENVTINLYTSSGTLITSTVSSSDGSYLFDLLLPGSYYTEIVYDNIYEAVLDNNGNPDTNSDITNANGLNTTDNITLQANDAILNIDYGLRLNIAPLCGIAWMDLDYDGIRITDEPFLPNVFVELKNESGQILSSTTTDINGNYCFEDLFPGTYIVTFNKTDDQLFSPPNIGSDDTDSDVIDDEGNTQIINHLGGIPTNNIDAGFANLGKVGDFVWLDENGNRIIDLNDIGVANIEVLLRNETGALIQQTITDSDGAYLFDKITPGNYYIEVIFPSNFDQVLDNGAAPDINSDFTNANGLNTSSTFTVIPNDVLLDLDFGLKTNLGSICGLTWFDENYDGIRTTSELLLSNVTVNLILPSNGSVISSTMTNDEGAYCFEDLEEGDYRIQFVIDDMQIFSPAQVGTPNLNSDVIDENGLTPFISILPGAQVTNIDAGIANKAIIGDYVFFDTNENNVQDIDDIAGEGFKLLLFDVNTNDKIDSVLSQADGSYLFDKLLPGDYYIQIELGDQYSSVLKSGSDDTIDSDITNVFGTNTTSSISVSANDLDLDIDFGILENKIAICGVVWKDLDADGIRTNADGLLDQPLFIELYDESDNLLSTRNSNLDGSYCFNDLDTGNYYIKVNIGPDLQFTEQDAGPDDTKDSDVNDLGFSTIYNLNFGDTIALDAGLTMTSSIGDFVWMDQNYNGLQEPLEPGIAGISVDLLDDLGIIIASTVTNHNGFYEFLNIKAGNYQIAFNGPDSLTFTSQNIDPIFGSDADANGVTPIFQILPNIDRSDIDAGLNTPLGSINGLVFTDLTNNNQRDSTDNLLPNIGVRLYDNNGLQLMATITGMDGTYSFNGLQAGSYYVEFDTSDVFEFVTPFIGGSDIDSDVTNNFSPGSTNLLNLDNGENINNIDAGYLGIMGLVKGVSWLDNDGDGIIQAEDDILPGVKVYLFSQDSTLVDSTVTNDLGLYTLDVINEGLYFIVFENQDTCFIPTQSIQGSNILLDSDIDNTFLTNSTDTFNIGDNNMVCGINAGYVGFSKLSGMSFIDENQDGIQEATDLGLNGIEIFITNQSGDTIAIDTTKTINGTDGIYEFTNLLPGRYCVSYMRPLFYFPTLDNIGNDTTDSDFIKFSEFLTKTDTIEISSKSNIEFVNLGLFFMQEAQSSISGEVWRDKDLNGLQGGDPLVNGITIELFDQDDNLLESTISDNAGTYSFEMLTEGFYYVQAYISNDSTTTLYLEGMDRSVDNDFNFINGDVKTEIFFLPNFVDSTDVDLGFGAAFEVGDFVFMDENFNGIQDPSEFGVEGIEISLLDINGDLYRSTISNSNGAYAMTRLLLGQYRLQATIPDTMSITKSNQGLIDEDNDFNKDGFTELITFDQIGNADTIDLGIVKNGCIGDRVFIDFNGNGRQNPGEPGQPGVKVMLYDVDNNFIALDSTKNNSGTGDNAFYKFVNIPPGDYYIVFDTLPGYMFTTPKIGGDAIDSDVTSSIVIGSTDIFTLQPDGFYMDIDAGIFLPGKLGDFVWEDLNMDGIQDAGEPGIPDQTIVLTTSSGAFLQSTITNADGFYCFGGLKQGLYQVRFPLIPDFDITFRDAGFDDTIDSDADPVDGRTSLISLAHGADFMGVDCGYFESTNSAEKNKVELQKLYNVEVVNPNPNPAIFETTIQVDEDGAYQLSLLNGQGQIAKQQNVEAINNIIWLDISDLRAGKYYFHLLGNNGKKYKGSFIRLY